MWGRTLSWGNSTHRKGFEKYLTDARRNGTELSIDCTHSLYVVAPSSVLQGYDVHSGHLLLTLILKNGLFCHQCMHVARMVDVVSPISLFSKQGFDPKASWRKKCSTHLWLQSPLLGRTQCL